MGSSGPRATSADGVQGAPTAAAGYVVDWSDCRQPISMAISRNRTCSPSSPGILASGAAGTCNRDVPSCEEL